MPPPSLSATAEAPLLPTIEKKKLSSASGSDFRPVLFPLKKTIPIHNDDEDEDEEDEETEYEEEDEEETEDDDDEDEDEDNKSISSKRSIPSFSKSQTPSTSTTRSYAMSSSPPKEEQTRSRWLETIAQLKKSLTRSTLGGTGGVGKKKKEQVNVKKEIVFIPMPLPPKRNIRKRRSEATTQPRFNPETNTYTRDTRSNPDHLRMISAELNMMRSRKLSSPLKPRGFLPRRTDSFIRGEKRCVSSLCKQV